MIVRPATGSRGSRCSRARRSLKTGMQADPQSAQHAQCLPDVRFAQGFHEAEGLQSAKAWRGARGARDKAWRGARGARDKAWRGARGTRPGSSKRPAPPPGLLGTRHRILSWTLLRTWFGWIGLLSKTLITALVLFAAKPLMLLLMSC